MMGLFLFGGLEFLLLMLVVPLGFLFTAFWVWMLVSAIQNRGLTESEKIAWVLAIVFLHVIGSILYLCIGHPKRHLPPVISI